MVMYATVGDLYWKPDEETDNDDADEYYPFFAKICAYVHWIIYFACAFQLRMYACVCAFDDELDW